MTPAAGSNPSVVAIVLAAGRSTRFGEDNKLLAEIGGKPMLRHIVEQVLASRAASAIVVTGHQRDLIAAALAGLPVRFVHNARYEQGIGTSVASGMAAVPADADGAVVVLGDMPQVDASVVDALIAAFDPAGGKSIVVPEFAGQRGNPVLWARSFFAELNSLHGDAGARDLITRHADAVLRVPVGGKGVLLDVDTRDGLTAVRGPVPD